MQGVVYIVEDDENIREFVIYALQSRDFEVIGFESGDVFWQELNQSRELPRLVLLDIMLPGEDGLLILQKIKRAARLQALPVIMLTAKGSELDKVKALDCGADDYVVKPFSVMELIARVNAVLRRSGKSAPAPKKITYQNIMLEDEKHIVLIDGEKVNLTFKEYELLRYLLLNQEIVMSRDKIMEIVWGYDFEGESRTVDMHIKTLRKKLGKAGEHIRTVRNVGYKIGE